MMQQPLASMLIPLDWRLFFNKYFSKCTKLVLRDKCVVTPITKAAMMKSWTLIIKTQNVQEVVLADWKCWIRYFEKKADVWGATFLLQLLLPSVSASSQLGLKPASFKEGNWGKRRKMRVEEDDKDGVCVCGGGCTSCEASGMWDVSEEEQIYEAEMCRTSPGTPRSVWTTAAHNTDEIISSTLTLVL